MYILVVFYDVVLVDMEMIQIFIANKTTRMMIRSAMERHYV